MTTRLGRAFADARPKKLLVVYLCVGDPSLAESAELAVAAAEAGADVLELGAPFSDPTADGPVIARASQRALAAGATLLGVLDVAAAVRRRTDVPIVSFGYYNPILVTGERRVVDAAAGGGVDALLVVDLPPEESGSLREAAYAAGIAVVPLVTPTRNEARLATVAAALAGGPPSFAYYVSVTGVTGGAVADWDAVRRDAAAVRARLGRPVVVGFGIDGPEAAVRAAGTASGGPDGVVVGTAIVRRIAEGADARSRRRAVVDLVGSIRAALDAR